MKLNFLIITALLLSIAGYSLYTDTGFHGQTVPEAPQTTGNGERAPDFSFTTLQGKSRTLHELQGKAIVLNFWATWCSPCVIEFPQMLNMAQKLPEEVIIVFVSTDDRKTDIERFLKKMNQKQLAQDNVLIAWDQDKKISQDLFQTFRLPETILISPDLVMKDKIIGADVQWDGKEMLERLRSLYKTP